MTRTMKLRSRIRRIRARWRVLSGVIVLTVASAAVTSVDGASVVTVKDTDGTEVSTPVTVGATVGNLTEITAGLAEGDEVIVATFTPGSGNAGTDRTGGFPGGEMPTGDFPAGQMPGGANNG